MVVSSATAPEVMRTRDLACASRPARLQEPWPSGLYGCVLLRDNGVDKYFLLSITEIVQHKNYHRPQLF
jgi:hypothetical protein